MSLLGFYFVAQVLARAGNGEALAVEQVFDFDDDFHVAAAVVALAGAAFYGMELGKFGFPKPQHIRWQAAQARDFADAEIELVWNQDVFGLNAFLRGQRLGCGVLFLPRREFLCRHEQVCVLAL